jgi:hypothetical protein
MAALMDAAVQPPTGQVLFWHGGLARSIPIADLGPDVREPFTTFDGDRPDFFRFERDQRAAVREVRTGLVPVAVTLAVGLGFQVFDVNGPNVGGVAFSAAALALVVVAATLGPSWGLRRARGPGFGALIADDALYVRIRLGARKLDKLVQVIDRRRIASVDVVLPPLGPSFVRLKLRSGDELHLNDRRTADLGGLCDFLNCWLADQPTATSAGLG